MILARGVSVLEDFIKFMRGHQLSFCESFRLAVFLGYGSTEAVISINIPEIPYSCLPVSYDVPL